MNASEKNTKTAADQITNNTGVGRQEARLASEGVCELPISAEFHYKKREPGISALYAAMGEGPNGQNSMKILEAFRTQLILSSQGAETVSYLKNLAGGTMRSTVSDNDEFESYWAYREAKGDASMSDDFPPFMFSDIQIENIKDGASGRITANRRTHVPTENAP